MTEAPIGFDLVILGGGRWGRQYLITLKTLRDQGYLEDLDNITLVSARTPDTVFRSDCEALVPGERIRFIEQRAHLPAPRGVGAAIVASAFGSHFDDTRICIDRGYHVLVEKPFFRSDFASTRLILDRAIETRRRVQGSFVWAYHDVLMTFLHEFETSDLSDVSVDWEDPKTEIRHGEVKSYDPTISVAEDVFPHLFGILWRGLNIDLSERHVSVKFLRGTDEARLVSQDGRICITARLVRDGTQRRRLISLTSRDGVRNRLDFAQRDCVVTQTLIDKPAKMRTESRPNVSSPLLLQTLAFLERVRRGDEIASGHSDILACQSLQAYLAGS